MKRPATPVTQEAAPEGEAAVEAPALTSRETEKA
jgi:hypothetical protein